MFLLNYIGQQMFIHGGVSDENEVLGDSFLFSLTNHKWYACSIDEECTIPKLCNHKSALVLPSEQKYNSKMTIYKLNDYRPLRHARKVIYTFTVFK